VLLFDSAFEHVVAFGQTTTDTLSKRISSLWPDAQQRNLMLWAIQSCLESRDLMRRRPDEAAVLEREIVTKSGHGRGTSLLVAYRQLDRLVALAASPLQATAVGRTIGQLGDPKAYAAEDDRLRRDAELMINRQRRVRNALTHGNPATRHVVASVVDFSRFRTVVALRAGLDSFAEGVPLETYLQEKAAERAKDDDLMLSGKSQIEIWEEWDA
jgi:hypothetical protein